MVFQRVHKPTTSQTQPPGTNSVFASHAAVASRHPDSPVLAKSDPTLTRNRAPIAPNDRDFTPIPLHPPTENRTGLPDGLKAGIEQLSGLSMDPVRVHYHSAKPAQLQALAYTQRTNIYVAPGQEQHLPHEAWHVVQQMQGRVKPTLTLNGEAMNSEVALEHEAEVMGEKADHANLDPLTSSPIAVGTGERSDSVIQAKLGFELEMLTLVDLDGRPIPEKTHIGTYGAHLTLDVDHGPAVAAPTPRSARSAKYDVDQHHLPGMNTENEIAMMHDGGPGPADPRLPLGALDFATWQANSNPAVSQVFTRPVSPIEPHVDNTALANLDIAIQEFAFAHANWEAATARAALTAILAQTNAWMTTNTTKPNKVFHPDRRARWRNVRNVVQTVDQQARVHQAFWTNPANNDPPANIVRAYRQVPTAGFLGAAGPWQPYQPGAGMGTNEYASILELVTDAYEPETPAGRANIMAAMTEAVTFATAIEHATQPNFTNRVQLNSIANTNIPNPQVHIGNANQPNQTTEASIQATGAIDLAQLPSYLLSITGLDPDPQNMQLVNPGRINKIFKLKHHSDTDDAQGQRAEAELPQAVFDATNAINTLKQHGDPSLVNLRGLVTLMCQYLRMGKYFFEGNRPLDKNVVPLLSRTNLSQIYDRLLTPAEKLWVTNNLVALTNEILTETARTDTSNLFNDSAETQTGGVTCEDFIQNVFTQPSDGVTDRLGGFRQINTEIVDPLGARDATDFRRGGVAHREGLVFELRNIIKPESFSLGRFPKNQWLQLARQQVGIIAALNAQLEAGADQDQYARYKGYGTGPRQFDVERRDEHGTRL